MLTIAFMVLHLLGAAQTAVEPNERVLRGTIVVGERVPQTGWFVLRLDSMGGEVVVPVENGRWQVEIPVAHDVLAVMHMHLDGRDAHAEPSRFWFEDYRRGSEYVIETRFTPRTTLRVFDAVTGVELPEVEVLVESAWSRVSEAPARGAEELQRTPLALDPWQDNEFEWLSRRRWWVGAPWHAWTRIEVDHGAGGVQRVELEPYGALRVEWRGHAHADAIHVCPAGHPRRPGDFRLWDGKQVTFDALPPGEYEVEARSRWMRWGRRASVLPGRTCDIVLQP